MIKSMHRAAFIVFAVPGAGLWAVAEPPAPTATLRAVGAGATTVELPPPNDAAPSCRRLDKQVIVSATLSQVWHAWTTPQGIASFFAPQSHIELRVGGPYEMYFDPSAPEGLRGSEGCRVLSYLPMEMLSFDWNAPPSIQSLRSGGVRTQVILRFTKLDDSEVKVVLTQLGFGEGEDWDRYYAYFDKAWTYVLSELQDAFMTSSSDSPATHSAQSGKPAVTAKLHWVYFVRPSREGFFDKATKAEERAVSEHARYIKRLTHGGIVILAGPSFDPPYFPDSSATAIALDMPAPGIVVFEAQSAEAAKKIMENDPAVQAGVFKARMHPFKLSFQRQ